MVLSTPKEKRTKEQVVQLLAWYKTIDLGWRSLNEAAEDHAKSAPKTSGVKALISSEGLPAVRLHTQGADFLEKTHFLKRGDPNQKQDVVAQGFLQILMRSPDQEAHWVCQPPNGWRTSYRRTSLANWATDVEIGAGALARAWPSIGFGSTTWELVLSQRRATSAPRVKSPAIPNCSIGWLRSLSKADGSSSPSISLF